jgi:four helix bundle protein
MANVESGRKIFDLEERTSKFAENIIDFVKKLPKDLKFMSIIVQLVRAATSVGANYCEADDAQSKKDFVHKISLCKKESRETKFWLRIVAKTFPEFSDEARKYWKESQELNLIFASIIRKKSE